MRLWLLLTKCVDGGWWSPLGCFLTLASMDILFHTTYIHLYRLQHKKKFQLLYEISISESLIYVGYTLADFCADDAIHPQNELEHFLPSLHSHNWSWSLPLLDGLHISIWAKKRKKKGRKTEPSLGELRVYNLIPVFDLMKVNWIKKVFFIWTVY